MDRDYVGIATDYAHSVVDGYIPACLYVRQACQRQLDDLARDDGWHYRFDRERAAHVCRFIELLAHIKGEWAGQPIVLEPWQLFVLTTVFGWVDEDGLRRYKTAYEEVPRKNAKSTLTSGVGLYLVAADGEPGAEVYSAATTRDQAKIVWLDAKRMADRSPGLQRRFGVETAALSVYVEETASWFKPLSRDQGGNLDGLNVHGGLLDELHAHKTREIYDVIESGTGSRRQPLLWQITTAGCNRAGICYEQRDYVIKILKGVVDDPEYFGIIYTIDDTDDWADETSWIKANPNWGVSVKTDDLRRQARKAMQVAAAQNNFLTKRLNVWVNADTAWMDMLSWERCGDAPPIEEFTGQRCWVAGDLASKIDIASTAKVFERGGHYYAYVRNYLNEDAAEDGRNSQYSGWARTDRLILTPGNVTDYGQIEDDLRQDAIDYVIAELALDPWQAEHIRQRLADEGLNAIEMRQTVANMSEPMKQLQALVLQGMLHHTGCPVLTWMISNVVCHIDAKDNIYPRKEFPENKIDGVVALIMALGRAITVAQQADTPEIEVW